MIQGCRRMTRRMRNLIREIRPIADDPEFAARLFRAVRHLRMPRFALLACRRRCRGDLAKCLRSGGVPRSAANRVDETLTPVQSDAACSGWCPAPLPKP